MRAALVQRPNVEGRALAALVLAGQEFLAAGVDQNDERPSVRHVGREALVDRQLRVLQLEVAELADRHLAAEAARKVGPKEADAAGGDLSEPQSHPGAERCPKEAAPRETLDLRAPKRLDCFVREGPRPIDRLDLIVAHLMAVSFEKRWLIRD